MNAGRVGRWHGRLIINAVRALPSLCGLVREDTRDKVAESEMRQAARLTGAILVEALTAETLDLRV